MNIDNINSVGSFNANSISKSQNIETLKTTKVDTENNIQPKNERPSEHDVIQAIEKANNHIKVYDRRLEFSIHEGTKQILVKVINTEDDSVIREIPSEKILDMVAHLWEMAGILVDEKR